MTSRPGLVERWVFHPQQQRPTVSLVVMLILGLLWCGLQSIFLQGDQPWEPYDQGAFIGWIVQYVVISAFLVFAWSKRVRGYLIVIAPVAIQLLVVPAAVIPGLASSGLGGFTNNDTLTVFDGFRDTLLWMIPFAVIIGASVLYRRTASRPC